VPDTADLRAGPAIPRSGRAVTAAKLATAGGRLAALQPGDVLAVRTPPTVFGLLIRFGAWLARKPNTVDHVAIVHHRDAAGILWAIEGRPGGVGWVDLAVYDNRWLVSNAAQPKTDGQREQICDAAVSLLGTGYDWTAIAADAAAVLDVDGLWRVRDYGDKAPGHVVCSSLAAWVYRKVGLAEPCGPAVTCTPGDWAAFCQAEGWIRGLPS
jgi:hypothetical protein